MNWIHVAIGLWILVGLIGIIIRFKEAGHQLDRMINWAAVSQGIEEKGDR